VVSGKYDPKTLARLIKKGRGKARLKTVSGALTAMWMAATRAAREKGGNSTVTVGDVYQSNGFIHVVNAVLMPT